MSVRYFAQSNFPVFKAVYGDAASTTFAVWTPAAGKQIILTDLHVSAAFAGTIRFFIGTSTTGPDPVVEFVQAGSVLVRASWDTPIVAKADQLLYCTGHTGGRIAVTATGFEQD